MLRRTLIIIFTTALALTGCSIEKLYQKKQTRTSPYQQVDFHALVKRYLKKDQSDPIEGIYSVSGVVTKKSKGFLGGSEKEKTTDRRENYAQVAILRDFEERGRDYIELSLDKEYQPSYSVVGEFNSATSGNILVYKHLGGKSKGSNYTFTSGNSELLEGIRVDTEGNSTVVYKLTYVKIYPK